MCLLYEGRGGGEGGDPRPSFLYLTCCFSPLAQRWYWKGLQRESRDSPLCKGGEEGREKQVRHKTTQNDYNGNHVSKGHCKGRKCEHWSWNDFFSIIVTSTGCWTSQSISEIFLYNIWLLAKWIINYLSLTFDVKCAHL